MTDPDIELILYSEWLDTNRLLGDTAEYPAKLTHAELVAAFRESTK